MGLGLAIRIVNAENGNVTARRVDRPSALIGRDSQMCDCVLLDGHVSKLHASIEVREGQLFVRDASSTNGTYVKGQRIDPNGWFCLGPANQEHELVISKWRISVRAESVDRRARVLSQRLASRGTDRPAGMGAGWDATYAMTHPLDVLSGPFAEHIAILSKMHAELRRSLESAPPSAREFIAQEATVRFALLLHYVEFQTLLTSYGAKLPLSPDRAALIAIQDLSRAHVDPKQPVSTPREIAVFATNLTMALGSLLSGTMQLFAGMSEFEQRMDLVSEESGSPSRRPQTPEALGRGLLDWRDRTEPALDMLGRRFSSLMMHQVAMLNGVMRGVKVLLTELAPKTLEKALARGSGAGGFWRRFFGKFFRASALWSLFSERYGDLADEENERFRLLFGPEFSSEYRQLAREAAGAGRGGSLRPSAPPPPAGIPQSPLPTGGPVRQPSAPPPRPTGPPPKV